MSEADLRSTDDMSGVVAEAVRLGMTHDEVMGFIQHGLSYEHHSGLYDSYDGEDDKYEACLDVQLEEPDICSLRAVVFALFRPEVVSVVAGMTMRLHYLSHFLKFDVAWYNPVILRGGGPMFYRSRGTWHLDVSGSAGDNFLSLLTQMHELRLWEEHASWKGFFSFRNTAITRVFAPVPESGDALDMACSETSSCIERMDGFCYLNSLVKRDMLKYAATYGPFPKLRDLVAGPLPLPDEATLFSYRKGVWHVGQVGAYPNISWKNLVQAYLRREKRPLVGNYSSIMMGDDASDFRTTVGWDDVIIGTRLALPPDVLSDAAPARSINSVLKFGSGGACVDVCRHLKFESSSLNLCDLCEQPLVLDWQQCHYQSGDCGAVSACRDLRLGQANMCVSLPRDLRSLAFQVRESSEAQFMSCEVARQGETYCTTGLMIVYYLSAGLDCKVDGMRVISNGDSTVVVGFGTLSVRIERMSESGLHIGMGALNYQDMVRFMHKNVGVDFGDQFARFSQLVEAQLWWVPRDMGSTEQLEDCSEYMKSGLPGVYLRYACDEDTVLPGMRGAAVAVSSLPWVPRMRDLQSPGHYELCSENSFRCGILRVPVQRVVAIPSGVASSSMRCVAGEDAVVATVASFADYGGMWEPKSAVVEAQY